MKSFANKLLLKLGKYENRKLLNRKTSQTSTCLFMEFQRFIYYTQPLLAIVYEQHFHFKNVRRQFSLMYFRIITYKTFDHEIVLADVLLKHVLLCVTSLTVQIKWCLQVLLRLISDSQYKFCISSVTSFMSFHAFVSESCLWGPSFYVTAVFLLSFLFFVWFFLTLFWLDGG